MIHNSPDCFQSAKRLLALACAIFLMPSFPGVSAAAGAAGELIPDVSDVHAASTNEAEEEFTIAQYGRSGSLMDTSVAESHDGNRSGSAHDYTFNIRLTPWLAQPGGGATLGSLGTDVDLHDDLGLDQYEVAPAGTANLRFGRHDFWVDAFALDISESSVVQRTITFGSLTIPVNRSVSSDVKVQLYDFRYGYSFFDYANHGFRFGPTVGVAYLDFDVRVTDQVAATSDSFSEGVPVPRLGLQGSLPIGPFELAARLSGLYVEYQDFDGYTIEGDVSIAWRPVPYLGLVGGYRAIHTDIDYNDDNFSLSFQGPYLGAELRF